MADELNKSENRENQTLATNQPQDTNGSSQLNSSKPNSSKRFRLPSFRPKIKLPKLNFGRWKSPPKVRNFLWLWLLIILSSYVCMGYFFSVLLTMPSQKNLAIAGFTIAVLLPTITAFADYALMKWGYLLSGFLIVGGLFYYANVRSYFMAVAIIFWIGITMIAFVGESLIKQKQKIYMVIVILTLPCLLGLMAGWQIWKLAAANLS